MGRAFRLVVILGLLTTGLTVPAIGLAAPSSGSASSPTYTFVSAPNLHPPRLQVLKRRAGIAQGYLLTANELPTRVGQPVAGQSGPLIMDSQEQPVWFSPTEGQPDDLQQQTYRGQPVLVWFDGQRLVLTDEHYKNVATLEVHAPWTIDFHDAYIAGDDVWVSVTRIVKNQNLSAYGGPKNGRVLDVGLQELSVSTGREIRTWDALNPGGRPNIPLSASKEPETGRRIWDAYHLNSVQALPNGDLLVSMRNTWAVYLIDPVKQRVIWTLGGPHSTFTLGSGVSFTWQHDARLVNSADDGQGRRVELTLFDDNNGDSRGTAAKPSAGLVLSLDTTTKNATLVHAYRHQPPLSPQVEGSMQLLSNGNALISWGSEPYFSEYSASGQELLDVRWPAPNDSYRVLFTDNWVGRPGYPPSGAVRGDTVYASWNGATQVARWQVLAGSSASSLKVVAGRARTGFETAIKLTKGYSDYEVRALDATGHVLGTSKEFS